MKLKIQTLHFTPSKKLSAFVNEKISKLTHLNDRIELAEVCLKLDKSDKTENKVCEIRLSVPGNDLFAQKQCKTFQEAVSETVDVLQRQIRKRKTKGAPQRKRKTIA